MKCVDILIFCVILISAEETAEQKFITANKLFTSDIYDEISLTEVGNFMVSPFSAERVLALVHSGCRGETAQELGKGLHLPESHEQTEAAWKATLANLSNKRYTLHTANRMYIDKHFSIKKQFKATATQVYNAKIFDLKNSTGVENINKWVRRYTQDKIKKTINSNVLNHRLKAVFINALYFKTKWPRPLKLLITRNAFEQSTKDGEASMTLSYGKVEEKLTSIEDQLVSSRSRITHLYGDSMRYLKIGTTINFKDILRALGVSKIFDANDTDLSGIAGEKGDLIVGEIVQKTAISNKGSGLNAASVTYLTITDPITALSRRRRRKIPTLVASLPHNVYIKLKNVFVFAGKV